MPSRDTEAERWTGEREPIAAALRTQYGFEKIMRTGFLMGTLIGLASRSSTFWQVVQPLGEEGKAKDLEVYGKVEGKLPGVPEAAVRAEAERIWRRSGSRRNAYDSIVGSGENSNILHYPRNERVMQGGELVLMDMAAEYGHYASDITRTLPVNGKFTVEQRKVYDVVLKAQQAALALVKPGAFYEDLDKAARKVIDDAGYGDYFIHGLGHFVGLDVHDAGAYHEPLQVGMVITLEPGIYIPGKNLGVRIEDEVVVTENGALYLSDGLPRTADAIERWMAARPQAPK